MSAKKKTIDLGDLMEQVEEIGGAKLATTLANKPPPKPKLHTPAEAALHKHLPVPVMTFDSKLNRYQNIHTQSLHHFYTLAWNAFLTRHGEKLYEAAMDSLAKYPLTGTNTYAKAMHRYRDVLLASAQSVPDGADLLPVTPLHKRSRLPDVTQEPLPLEAAPLKAVAEKTFGTAPKKGSKKAKLVSVGLVEEGDGDPAAKVLITEGELDAAALSTGFGGPSIPDHENCKCVVIGVDTASGPDQTAVVMLNPSAATDETDATLEAIESGALEVDDDPEFAEVDDPNVDAPAPDEFPDKPPITYQSRATAKTAAIAEMGPEAIEGIDFKLEKAGKRWAVVALA